MKNKKKNIALSEQFQNPKEKNVERVKIDTYNTQIQYTAHFPGIVQALQKVAE